MNVLVVEDDQALGAFLASSMKLEGHQVDWVADGDTALQRAMAHPPDLVILDLSLPRRDGMEVLEEMRSQHNDALVLVLTGRNEMNTRVNCLNSGADDCLLKPFRFDELTARCRALMRRSEKFADPVLRHGELHLNRISRKVTRGKHTVDLTAKEFALLEYLMLHRGSCVSRTTLLAEVWQMSPTAETNVVDVYVNYVRRKLAAGNENPSDLEWIHTVRGSGYRIGGVPAKPIQRVRGNTATPSHARAAS